jgi:hypothetical protein
MSSIKRVTCTCRSVYQDNRYGKDKRVANSLPGGGHRCTVCSTIHKNESKVK